jgi:hypothetical protein
VPDADEVTRRAAGLAFGRLTEARDVLLVDLPVDPLDRARWAARPGDEHAPRFRRVPRRGPGGSLVVLVVLAFLLVGLVSLEQSYEGWASDPARPAGSTLP